MADVGCHKNVINDFKTCSANKINDILYLCLCVCVMSANWTQPMPKCANCRKNASIAHGQLIILSIHVRPTQNERSKEKDRGKTSKHSLPTVAFSANTVNHIGVYIEGNLKECI